MSSAMTRSSGDEKITIRHPPPCVLDQPIPVEANYVLLAILVTVFERIVTPCCQPLRQSFFVNGTKAYLVRVIGTLVLW